MLHPSAFVHQSANVHESAIIGPWCVVDEGVEIGENVVLESRVRVYGGVTIKANTHVYDGAILGAPPTSSTQGSRLALKLAKIALSANIRRSIVVQRKVVAARVSLPTF